MTLINGDELRSETEANDGHVDFFIAHELSKSYAEALLPFRGN